MKLLLPYIGIIIATISLSGCIKQVKPLNAVERPTALLRGTLYKEGNAFALRLCGSSSTVSLLDSQNVLEKHLVRKGVRTPSLYVELDALALPSDRWQLDQLWFVSYQPKRCEVKTYGADFTMYGLQGNWFAQVKGREISVNRRDIFTTLNYSVNEDSDDQWRGEIAAANNRHYKLALSVKTENCIDHKGQWYALSSALKFNNQTFNGCARKGDSQLISGAGEYTNALSNDDAFVVLNLASDYTAELILDYRNGQPLIVKQGEWKMDENRMLALHLTLSDGIPEQNLVLFQMLRNGQLRNRGYSDFLGASGLQLSKTR